MSISCTLLPVLLSLIENGEEIRDGREDSSMNYRKELHACSLYREISIDISIMGPSGQQHTNLFDPFRTQHATILFCFVSTDQQDDHHSFAYTHLISIHIVHITSV